MGMGTQKRSLSGRTEAGRQGREDQKKKSIPAPEQSPYASALEKQRKFNVLNSSDCWADLMSKETDIFKRRW